MIFVAVTHAQRQMGLGVPEPDNAVTAATGHNFAIRTKTDM